jgi:hypothetical protein
VAVVTLSIVVGIAVGYFAESLVPGVPMDGGGLEGTPAHLAVLVLTFALVAGVGGLVGVLYVWRVLE